MENAESLSDSLELYKTQLSQITETLKVTPLGLDRDNLISLKNDIEELLKLTQDSIDGLQSAHQVNDTTKELPDDDDPFSKEYALFKAELESLNTESNQETNTDKQTLSSDNNDDNDGDQDEDEEDESSIKDELQSLVGTKCRAPYSDKSGSTTYYNALISSVEIAETVSDLETIKVRVLFINPTEKKMVPCPYYLDDKCKFIEDNCNFSHGYIVPFDHLKEYIEPNFTLLKPGCRILAKVPNLNIWISTVVEDLLNNDTCVIKHERAFVEVPIHDVLPPLEDTKDEDLHHMMEEDDADVNEEDEDVNLMMARQHHREAMIDMSLSNDQSSYKLGQWEQFTKGIGSKLMAKMGYIVGTGLGKSGEGILQPVEPVILPAGKSLDHCMNLKEAAGGSNNLFSLERMQKKLAAKAIAKSKREYFRKKKMEKDVFFVINTSIRTRPSSSMKNSSKNVIKNLNTISDRQLNVERFKLAESINQSEKNIKLLKRSLEPLDGHKSDAIVQKHNATKLENEQSQLHALKYSDNKLEREQIRRKTKKKMTIF